MSVERGTPRGERTSQPTKPEQKQNSPEAGAGPLGLPPPTLDQTPHTRVTKSPELDLPSQTEEAAPAQGGHESPGVQLHEWAKPPTQENQERQQAQGVWVYLERREKLHDWSRGIEADTRVWEQYPNGIKELARLTILRAKIIDEGTALDNLILKMYETKIELGSATPRYSLSSLEEFEQFRSKYESMPEGQLPEEIRKQEKENRRKWLSTATKAEKRKDWSRRYRQRRKEQRRLEAEKQQPTQVFPPTTKA